MTSSLPNGASPPTPTVSNPTVANVVPATVSIAATPPVATGATSSMASDDVTVTVPGSADVEGAPRRTFEHAVRDYAIDVLDEASRREVAARGSSSTVVQYTSAYFESARIYVRDRGYVPKVSRWYPWARLGVPIAFCFAGIAIPLIFAENAWVGWGFVAGGTLVAATILSIVLEFAPRRKETP